MLGVQNMLGGARMKLGGGAHPPENLPVLIINLTNDNLLYINDPVPLHIYHNYILATTIIQPYTCKNKK